MVVLKSLFFMILGLSVVVGIVPWLLLHLSGGVPRLTPSVWLVGLLPLLVGLGLFLWCDGVFTFIGKGTLAPIDAPKFLVRAGPYQWVRNPMYIALFLMISGEAILSHSLLLAAYVLLLWVTVHLYVLFIEERMLRRRFGESYEIYLRTVPRWLPSRPRVF
jgi:protein-S-isoprenylcysteine O-methyltransferase Ste14